MTMTTRLCRVGEVEGPFRPPSHDLAGDPISPKRRHLPRPVYWHVSYMDGTIRHAKRFRTRAAAEAFWASLPEYN